MAVNYQVLSGELITENSELKDQLSHTLQELEEIYHIVGSESNNMRLGKMIRKVYLENTEEVDEPVLEDEPVYIYESPDEGKTLYKRQLGDTIREQGPTEEPVSVERAEARLKYLQTELNHSRYHDGWTIKGMEEEVEWIQSQLSGRQMELDFEEQ
jgi:hypothetical protein